MSQNLHQFFQITDMISRLERQFFLPRYIIKHLVHTHSFGSCHIILPTIAYHQRITHLGLCGRKGKMKNFGPGLQDTDVIRENNLLKKVVNACRTYLMTLQLLEAVGKDIEVIFPRLIFQYLIRMRHQPTFCGNDRKEIIRKSLGQSSIPRPYCLQRI